MAKPTVQSTVRLPADLHRALRIKLAREGKSFSAWVKEVAAAYVK